MLYIGNAFRTGPLIFIILMCNIHLAFFFYLFHYLVEKAAYNENCFGPSCSAKDGGLVEGLLITISWLGFYSFIIYEYLQRITEMYRHPLTKEKKTPEIWSTKVSNLNIWHMQHSVLWQFFFCGRHHRLEHPLVVWYASNTKIAQRTGSKTSLKIPKG